MRDILSDEDTQAAAVAATLAQISPDIILLTGIDWDAGQHALAALNDRIGGAGYPYLVTLRPNRGMATALDLDGDGRTGGPGDAQGYGRFSGQGAMALLSRLEIDRGAIRNFTGFLWKDLPGALLPERDGAPFPSIEAHGMQRLSSTGHWEVPVRVPGGGVLYLLAFSAGPPVFDGPEDRNGRRNHDEVVFWTRYLDGDIAGPAPEGPVVLLGRSNLDPEDGEGWHAAMAGLLGHPRLQDPRPGNKAGAEAARAQGGANDAQSGDPALDTADWSDIKGPGNLRISYVLPDAGLAVTGAAVVWPSEGGAESASRHRLVWVDVEF